MIRALSCLLLVACAHRVPHAVQPATSVPYCFGFTYVAKGRTLQARACWQAANICAEASRLVVKHGGLAHVVSVGLCEEVE